MIFVVFKKSMRKHIFKTSNIFCIKKESIQNMLGYWPYAIHKKTFFYIFVETSTSQLDVNIKMESSKPSYIL